MLRVAEQGRPAGSPALQVVGHHGPPRLFTLGGFKAGGSRSSSSSYPAIDFSNAGRGDSLAMTDIARVIAHPTDDEAERRALQTAFMNSPVFFKLYEESAKGKPLAPGPLGNRAVLNFGVAPGSKDRFVQSFVDSAVAAGLAEQNEDGQIVLAPLEFGTDAGLQSTAERPIDNPQPVQSPSERTQPGPRQGTPVVHQMWAIEGGSIVFEIRTDRPLPASAFATVGEVVASLERLAETLALHAPVGGDKVEETEA
jgi:hypothetical protein